jgi:lysyl oxidase
MAGLAARGKALYFRAVWPVFLTVLLCGLLLDAAGRPTGVGFVGTKGAIARRGRGYTFPVKLICLLAAAAFTLTLSSCTAASGQGAAALPVIRLVATAGSVTDYSYPGVGAILNLPVYLMPVRSPFEIQLTRASYSQPITARRILGTQVDPLPEGAVNDFYGLPNFFHIAVSNLAGTQVLNTTYYFCPVAGQRLARDAPAHSPYPQACSVNPFTLGAVWGISPGWGASAADGSPAELSPGTYQAVVSVAPFYQKLFGISGQQVRVKITVRPGTGQPSLPAAAVVSGPPPGELTAGAAPPSGPPHVPADLRPDLRALPAWAITMAESRQPDGKPQDLLQFAATVWNAGPVPLEIVGFRPPGSPVMKAYQYFRTRAGTLAGYAPVGILDYDNGAGHHHWHYHDLAVYQLLSADRKTVLVSQKTGFCLANTDVIDYTMPGAQWQPGTPSLAAACGSARPDASSAAMLLGVGSGDTYVQTIAGQSFDVTGIPNGTYYIEIAVNPLKGLYLASGGAGPSFRQIRIGGKPGARTVTVQPVGLINS